jgi:polysaccharide export outer membrane protein
MMKKLLPLSFVAAAFAAFAAGCAAPRPPFVWASEVVVDANEQPKLGPRDTILVDVREQPTLSGEFVIRDDGHYLQPGVGSILVGGLTPAQATQALTVRLRPLLTEALASVWLSRPAPVRVSVVGEVKTPGTFELSRERGLLAVLAMAGWINEFADPEGIYVVRPGEGRRIRFRLVDVTTPRTRAAEFKLREGDVVLVE